MSHTPLTPVSGFPKYPTSRYRREFLLNLAAAGIEMTPPSLAFAARDIPFAARATATYATRFIRIHSQPTTIHFQSLISCSNFMSLTSISLPGCQIWVTSDLDR